MHNEATAAGGFEPGASAVRGIAPKAYSPVCSNDPSCACAACVAEACRWTGSVEATLADEIRGLIERTPDSAMEDRVRHRLALALEALTAGVIDRFATCASTIGACRTRIDALEHRLDRLQREVRDLCLALHQEHLLATTDALTGIPNRLAFEHRMTLELQRRHRQCCTVSLMLWDVDAFKAINDQHGHVVGDAALRGVGQTIAQHVRASDFLARLGGDEFVVVLVGADVAQSQRVAEKIHRSLAALAIPAQVERIKLSASCGIAEVLVGDTVVSVLERADRALYAAKDQRRAIPSLKRLRIAQA